jgi:hypothetical protein
MRGPVPGEINNLCIEENGIYHENVPNGVELEQPVCNIRSVNANDLHVGEQNGNNGNLSLNYLVIGK